MVNLKESYDFSRTYIQVEMGKALPRFIRYIKVNSQEDLDKIIELKNKGKYKELFESFDLVFDIYSNCTDYTNYPQLIFKHSIDSI